MEVKDFRDLRPSGGIGETVPQREGGRAPDRQTAARVGCSAMLETTARTGSGTEEKGSSGWAGGPPGKDRRKQTRGSAG